MQSQADLFPETVPTTPVRKGTPFAPTVLARAPENLRSLPERTEGEKIGKAKAILKWVMSNYRTSFCVSGGKDSGCVMGLAMCAAAELRREGLAVQPFAVLSADTLVDNPAVQSVLHTELRRLRVWFARHNLPGSVHIATPYLSAQFAVNVIGGRSLPSTAQTKRDCTIDLKSLPLSRLRKSVLGKNDVRNGQFVVSVSGVRFSESTTRAANMSRRCESSDSLVVTNVGGDVALAPIANWSWDDVFLYLSMANNGLESTYSDFGDLIQVYRHAMGECMILGSGDDLKASRPCSARTGCWTCLMVSEDKSMNQMIEEPANAYMRPLAGLRTFLDNTFFDLSRRTWVGRTIDEHGYIKFAPDGYSPTQLQDLLRYTLTIQFEEAEAAKRLGIPPRFTIISDQALIAIDCLWSLQGFSLPFTALAIYRDIVRGARYPVPDTPMFPKVDIPKARYIHVGDCWNQRTAYQYTGLRDIMSEAFGGEGCMGTRQILTHNETRTVMDVNTGRMFTVDEESAVLILELELDRLVDQWHGPDARPPLAYEGFHVAGVGYRFYASYGAIRLAKGHEGQVDEILRRTAFRERLGLAGYHYNHDRALAMSVEVPVPASPSPEDILQESRGAITARRDHKRHALQQRRLNLVELKRDWAPDISWRRLIQHGVLQMVAIPRYRRGRMVLRHLITRYQLISFLVSNPLLLQRVKLHRRLRTLSADLFQSAA